MLLKNLSYEDDAPKMGTVLLYTRQQVYFDTYNSLEEIKSIAGNEEILEIHLFDETKEYRAIVSQSARFEKGFIEYVADFPLNDAHYIYVDDMKLDAKNISGKLSVINHLKYQDGMVEIDDFRMVMKGGEANG